MTDKMTANKKSLRSNIRPGNLIRVCVGVLVLYLSMVAPTNSVTSSKTFGSTTVRSVSTIPGAKYLGKSVNVLEGKNEPGSKSVLQDLSDTEIESLTGGDWESNSEISEDFAEASSKYALSIGLDAEYGAFSGSSSLKFSKEVKTRTNSKIVRIFSKKTTSEVSIKSSRLKLTDEFKTDLNDPAFSAEDLFKDYGTHITEGVLVGGRIDGFFTSLENTREANERLEVEAKASYGGVTGSVGYTKETSSTNIKKRLNSTWILKGGTAKDAAALDLAIKNGMDNSKTGTGDDTIQKVYKNWADSAEKDPAFFAFTRINPIWKYATDGARRKELELAFKYMFTKKSLENLGRFVITTEKKEPFGELTIQVPGGYKIVSGGARVEQDPAGANLLTASYPGEDLRTWKAYHKEHARNGNSSDITVYAFAVYDPFDLLEIKVFPAKSESVTSKSIKQESSVPADFVLVGGGSNAEYEVHGSLLTGSGPTSKSTWTSTAQTHIVGDTFTLTSYAIGLKFKDPKAPYTITTELTTESTSMLEYPNAIAGVRSGYFLVGGGVRTENANSFKDREMQKADGINSFLISSFPEGDKWKASSRSHHVYSTAVLRVSAIGMKISKK